MNECDIVTFYACALLVTPIASGLSISAYDGTGLDRFEHPLQHSMACGPETPYSFDRIDVIRWRRESPNQDQNTSHADTHTELLKQSFYTLPAYIYCKFTNNPPSTNNCAPVTYPLNSSLARNTAGPARSRGSPVRPSGMRPSMYLRFSSSARSLSLSCVLMVPGSSALQRMACLPRAQAADWMRLRTPALVGV